MPWHDNLLSQQASGRRLVPEIMSHHHRRL